MSSRQGMFSTWSVLRIQLLTAFLAILTLMAVGTVVYHYMEHWSWVTSFYFSVCTLTTVGYGDFYPTSDLSRLFTAIYVLVGVGIVFASLTLIGAAYLRRGERALANAREAISMSQVKT